MSEGDLHDKSYDRYLKTADLNLNPNPRVREVVGHCIYEMRIYPTREFELDYRSNVPTIYACLTGLLFALLVVFFYVYDHMVRLRNMKMIFTAARSNAIVTSMFPDAIREQLLGESEQALVQKDQSNTEGSSRFLGGKTKVKRFISTGNHCEGAQIAELFLDATVIFMDICGFTAWSSTRHPDQVFMLLQSVYQEFDQLAKRRGVFKIETIGDCWVGVVGVPEPQSNHSAIALLFARACIVRMRRVVRKLEVTLGPDTADLNIRVGINSGPVTAGVLKGDRARFQLFGDTVNTTARLESTGKPACIHVSQETAKQLQESGKQNWVVQRDDCIFAKGKGELTTYWVDIQALTRGGKKQSECSGSSEWGDASVQEDGDGFDKLERLIDWNVSILMPMLKAIVYVNCCVSLSMNYL